MIILIDYDRILRVSKFCGKIITFFLLKTPIQNCFWEEHIQLMHSFEVNIRICQTEKVMSTEAKPGFEKTLSKI